MLTASVTLLAIGTLMVPGGVFTQAPPAVSVAVIITGSSMVVVGATLGFVPIRWTELSIGGLKGQVETRDHEFRDFYREHRDQLQRFATLMCGDRREARDLVREACARTRLRWTTGASADPLLATLRSLVHWLEQPGVWLLFVSAQSGRRRRWWQRRRRQDPTEPPGDSDQHAMLQSLDRLSFAARAALLLDGLLGLSVPTIAELLGRSQEQVRADIEAALTDMNPLLWSPPEAGDARG